MLLAFGGLLYSIGAVVYACKRPDPLPRVFGYHEVFHTLVVAAAAAHFSAQSPSSPCPQPDECREVRGPPRPSL